MNGIVYKELIRFLKQKSRFFQHLYDLFYGFLFFLLDLKQHLALQSFHLTKHISLMKHI